MLFMLLKGDFMANQKEKMRDEAVRNVIFTVFCLFAAAGLIFFTVRQNRKFPSTGWILICIGFLGNALDLWLRAVVWRTLLNPSSALGSVSDILTAIGTIIVVYAVQIPLLIFSCLISCLIPCFLIYFVLWIVAMKFSTL